MLATKSSSMFVRAVARPALLSRHFSSECAPAEKLRNIFEEYRLQNYSQETPYRFKREMVSAAQRLTPHKEGEITVDCLNQILVNIGRSEDRLSREELDLILAEANAGNDRSIPVEKLLQLM